MIAYLLKSTACLLVFLVLYKLVLEREKMHKFNRFYLLTILVLSFGIPLITFTSVVEIESTITLSNNINPILPANFEGIIEEPTNRGAMILGLFYGLGFFFFSSIFIKNCVQLYLKVSTNERQKTKTSVQVLLQKNVIPHTFLKYIFLEKKALENNEIPTEVLLHEEAHVAQKHSLDVLFIELLQIMFWFNPLIYLVKYSIKLNHEFLADDAVLQNETNHSAYAKILLSFSQPNNSKSISLDNGMSSSINYSKKYSSIKKRFKIMKTKTSNSKKWVLTLLLLPVTALLIYGFSNKTVIEKEVALNNTILKEQIQKLAPVSIQENKPQESKQNQKVTVDSYYAGVRFLCFKKGLQYTDTIIGQDVILDKLYEDLTEEDKEITKFFLYVPKPRVKKSPTKTQMDEVLNPKKFAVWIDGKNVPNSELKKYNREDFAYYSGRMFIHETGRKGKYPQPFWAMFSTHDHFDAQKMGEQQTHYAGESVISYKSTTKMRKKYNE